MGARMAKPNEQKPNDNKGKRTLDLHRTFGIRPRGRSGPRRKHTQAVVVLARTLYAVGGQMATGRRLSRRLWTALPRAWEGR